MNGRRLCFVSPGYPPATRTGIASAVACIAGPLARRGHEVHVVTWEPDDAGDDRVVDGVWVHRRPMRYIPGVRRLLTSPAVPRIVVDRLPQQSLTRPGRRLGAACTAWLGVRELGDFDVVEVPDFMAAGLLLETRACPVVATTYGPLLVEARYCGFPDRAHLRAAIAVERWSVERADAVISCTDTLRSELRDAGWGGALADATIIPNAIDLPSWEPIPQVSGRRLVIAGHVTPRKGHDVLISALRSLRRQFPDVELEVVGSMGAGRVGDRPFADEVYRLVGESGAAVRFTEHVTRTELAGIYAAARAVVVPSRFDNCPMTALEAMAMARPVITTDRAGLGAASRDGVTVARVGDPIALAEAITPFLDDRDLADEAGRHARARVEREHHPDLLARKREAVYDGIIGELSGARTRRRRFDLRRRTT